MRKDLLSLGFALALGTIIGGLCADEIAARFTYGSYFWAFGALFGGIISWCVVDFRHFCAGVKRSYRDTIAWRPNLLYWKTFGVAMLGVTAMTMTVFIYMVGGFVYLMLLDQRPVPTGSISDSTLLFYAVVVIIVASLFAGALVASMMTSRSGLVDNERYKKRLLRVKKEGFWQLTHWNPLSATIYVIYYALKGTLYVVVRIPAAMPIAKAAGITGFRTVRAFIVGVFINVQSERRMIALIFATAGAAVFHSFDSVIIGLVVGVGFGLLEYEIVSVRWLKLVPAKAK